MLLFRTSALFRIDKAKFVARSFCGTKHVAAQNEDDSSIKISSSKSDTKKTQIDNRQKEAKAKLQILLESMDKELPTPNAKTSKVEFMDGLKTHGKKKKKTLKPKIGPHLLKAIEQVADTYTENVREEKKQGLVSKLEAVVAETEQGKLEPFDQAKLSDLLGSMNVEKRQSTPEFNMSTMSPPIVKAGDSRGSAPLERRGRGAAQREVRKEAAGGAKLGDGRRHQEPFRGRKAESGHVRTPRADATFFKLEPEPEKIDRVFTSETIGIFKDAKFDDPAPTCKLETWERLYQKELELSVTHPPANGFEQMIRWTKQGKMWHFPINNEQGLDKEAEVGFHEHVFLDRHLEPWCPKRGPIRHFMELVVVGLSKNPYMTLETKLGHIRWFREFFAEHHSILVDSGAMGDAVSSSPPRVSA